MAEMRLGARRQGPTLYNQLLERCNGEFSKGGKRAEVGLSEPVFTSVSEVRQDAGDGLDKGKRRPLSPLH